MHLSVHRYGTYLGRRGIPHAKYFPHRRRAEIAKRHIHLDPEFETLTYGDPTSPKRALRKLDKGDFLIFYCGLQPWDEKNGRHLEEAPGLYIVGYFKVEMAGMASNFSDKTLRNGIRKQFPCSISAGIYESARQAHSG